MQICVLSRAWRIFLLIAGGLCFLSSPAFAQRRPTAPAPSAPPQPMEQSVRVKRGGTAEIPLRIYGTRNHQLEFLIRVQPEAGKLSEPRQAGQQSALVTYTPPVSLEVTRDKFSYAVRSTEGVSAAVDVLITILDDPSQLIVPDTLQFPRLLVDETAEMSLDLMNGGGGMAEGEVKVEAPWKIVGESHYRLGAGERHALKITFAPTAGGVFQSEAIFTSRPDRVTTLRGEAFSPIAFEPVELELKHPPGNPLRVAAFELVNNLAEEQAITLRASDRLSLPLKLTIPAGGRSPVVVQTDPQDMTALNEEISAEANGKIVHLRVRAASVGPILRAVTERINLGAVPAGMDAQAMAEIENIGGTAVTAALETDGPFSVREKSIAIAAGEKKGVELVASAPRPGHHEGTLAIRGSHGVLRISLAVNVTARGAMPGVFPTASRPVLNRPLTGTTVGKVRAESSPDTMPAGLVRGQVREVTPESATIEWRVNPELPGPFRAETGTFFLENKQLKITWAPYATFETRTKGDRVLGTLRKLEPGTVHRMRILAAGRAGEGAPLFEIQFMTPPQPRRSFRLSSRGILLTVLVAGMAAVLWKRFVARRASL